MRTTELIDIDIDFTAAVKKAAELYREGEIFVYPTDTIYGFGGNPFMAEAVEKVTAMKRRSIDKQYIMLVNKVETLLKYTDIVAEHHIDFLMNLWPNPVSVILPLNSSCAEELGAATGAFRIPYNNFCMNLLEEIARPMISTSVNRSGSDPLNDHNEIRQEFDGEPAAIFFSGKPGVEQSSTVISLTGEEPELIREGGFPFEEIMYKFRTCRFAS